MSSVKGSTTQGFLSVESLVVNSNEIDILVTSEDASDEL